MYATPSDLINRYTEDQVQLVAELNGGVDQDKVIGAQQDAADEIDVYLANRYELPVPNVPRVLVRLSCDIAMYRLSADHGLLTEEKRKRYEDAIKLLDKIAAGKAQLNLQYDPATADDLDGDGEPDVLGDDAEFNSAPRLFSRESMSGIA